MIVEAIESAVRYASSAHYVPRRPSANRGWRIFSRLEEGRSHRQMWALHVTTGEEILLFNLNDYVKQGGYAQVGAIALSNDARFVVFALDDTGAEDFTLRCRDLRSNKDIIEPVSAACRGAAIDSVSGAFFYTVMVGSAHVVYARRFSDPERFYEIYRDTDPSYSVSVSALRSTSFLKIVSRSMLGREVRVRAAGADLSDWVTLCTRCSTKEFLVEHVGEYLITVERATNGRAVLRQRHQSDAERVLASTQVSQATSVDSVLAFSGFLALSARIHGFARILSFDPQSRALAELVRTSNGHCWLVPDKEYFSDSVTVAWSSLSHNKRYIDVSVAGTVAKSLNLPTYTEAESKYVEYRIFCTSTDGTNVPISIAHLSSDSPLRGAVLACYGAYGRSLDATFSSTNRILLDQGYAIAIAHVRGGGEFGPSWHYSGSRKHKINGVLDLITAARYLVDNGFSFNRKVSVRTASAGAYLAAMAINLAPELFDSVVMESPFLDPYRSIEEGEVSMVDLDRGEWFDVDESLLGVPLAARLSPVDEVSSGCHPAILVVASDTDRRISVSSARLYFDKLRQVSAGGPFELWSDADAGHWGPSTGDGWVKREARILSFILGHSGA